MNFFFVNRAWEGDFIKYIAQSFNKIGEQTYMCNVPPFTHWSTKVKLQNISYVKTALFNKEYDYFNRVVYEDVKKQKPDVVFCFNNGKLYPETLRKIRKELNCKTVCLIADSPFDSSRDKYTALCLPYFDVILVGEKMWIPNIKKMAPNSRIEYVLGGYNPNIYNPIDENSILKQEREMLQCDISFTGAAYAQRAEGNYRAGILGSLPEYNLKIWGDKGWKYRERFYPSLGKAYQGTRLTFDHLLKLYTLSKINLNMPSPQILTAFQPRVFEIAATKSFQIIDYREDLLNCYNEDEIVTFKTIPELKEKIKYYLNNTQAKNTIVENMYNKTINIHSWEQRAIEYLKIIQD